MRSKVAALLRRRDGALLGQLLRYVLSGGLAFCIDFGLMVVLREWGDVREAVAASVGNFVGLVITYILSVVWIFDRRRFSNVYLEFGLFFLIGLSGTALTYLLMRFLADGCGLYYMIAKLVTVAMVTLWNFVAKKLLLFSRPD
ncbi:MAG: GtrA family protein [Bacteroidales bacterium]|nr:GtrA family protein [Bacteroidales bacterium]